MGLPKKNTRKPIEERISVAIETATTKNNFLKNTSKKNTSGRPNLRGKNITKHTVLLNEKTSNRFEGAFIKERSKFRKKGEKLDKSLLYEIILNEWLKAKGY